jgi:hypothetical protein
MTPADPTRRAGGRELLTAEARQVMLRTWATILVVTAVVAGLVLADRDAHPVLSGVLVTIPVLELMIFGVWYRRWGGRRH